MTRVDLRDVRVAFRRTLRERRSLGRVVLDTVAGRRQDAETVVALDGLSLALERGARLAIVGHNGAGKSTVLRVLAGVYPATSGTCRVDGTIGAMLDATLGFERDASGRQNAAFRLYLRGHTRRTAAPLIDAIAALAELGPFLDRPVVTYSDGMRARLAFALAAVEKPQILLLDEAFGAMDESFRGKAREHVRTLAAGADVVVAVSHDLDLLRSLCDQALWLEHGRVRRAGPIDAVLAAYKAEAGDATRAVGGQLERAS